MNPLLIIGGLGAVALYLWSTQSSGGSAAAPPPLPASQANATLASTQQGTVPYSGGYGTQPAGTMQAVDNAAASGAQPVANNAPPGAPTGATSSAGAPLFHTGFSDANSGAVIATDGYGTGNPYLV